jgi:hypothetical protein
VAAGRNPDSLERGGHTPLGYLRSLQQSDGSVRYSKHSRQTPVWVTADALAALARHPLRLASAAPRSRPHAARAEQARAAAAAHARSKRHRRARAKAAAAAPDGAPGAAQDTPAPVALAPASRRSAAKKPGGMAGDERAALIVIAVAALGGGAWFWTRWRHPGRPLTPA